jgi:hypothetical protein
MTVASIGMHQQRTAAVSGLELTNCRQKKKYKIASESKAKQSKAKQSFLDNKYDTFWRHQIIK